MAEAILAFEPPPEEIDYPESDGQPMAETDAHRDDLAEIIFTLQRFFDHRSDVYVSGNLFLYYEKGNPQACKAPDIFVVFGVANEQRRTYRLWEEGKAPTVAIELTSKSTREEDQKVKPDIYANLGIEYLFLYDVLGEYLDPPLQGLRLVPGGPHVSLAGPRKGPFACPPLGLDLVLDDDDRLQFVDRQTGVHILRERKALDESLSALKHAEGLLGREIEARKQESRGRKKAEARAEQEAVARRQEAKARQEAEAKAEQEAEARRQALAEIERLRSELYRARPADDE